MSPAPLPSPASAATEPATARHRRLGVLLLASLWVVIAVLDASQYYLHSSLNHKPVTWGFALTVTTPWWVMWALCTPLIFAVAAAFPLERGRLARSAPAHLLTFAAMAAAQSALYCAIQVWHGWPAEDGFTYRMLLLKYLVGKPIAQLVTYLAVVGCFHALEYQRRLREREVQAAELRARLSEAHLQALRTQLQPHFLFNTLNAVSVLTLKGETQCAIRMLSRLSDLLRLTLETSASQEVSLREELETLERYVEIERVRFHDRLEVEIGVDPEARDGAVPHLLTQPLVENAVRHGIAHRVEGGRIEVHAARVGDRLRLRVSDTGPGFAADAQGVREGIGLSNTRARLAQLYGGAGRLSLENAPGGGAVVTVEIPWRSVAGAPRSVPAEQLAGVGA